MMVCMDLNCGEATAHRQGTYLVKILLQVIYPAPDHKLRRLAISYFAVGTDQLWTSDGTEAGTQFVKTIPLQAVTAL